MYPEAGGSASFARRAFNEFWSFFAAWAQMLTYICTIAISAFFVPHYIGGLFWEPLRHSPGDIVVGAIVIALLAGDQHLRRQGVDRRQRAAGGHRLHDAAAARGRRRGARALAGDAGRQRRARRRADVEGLRAGDPDRHARLHGHRDDLEHVRGGPGRGQDDPGRDQPRAHRGLRDLLHAAGRRAVGAARAAARRRHLLHAARPAGRGGRLRGRPDPRVRQADRPRAAAGPRGALRRPAGGDDPVPGHQRGHHRRLAARLLDGHPPPAARRSAATAPALPHAVDRDPRLLGPGDPDPAARPGGASWAASTRSGRCCRSRSPTPR